MTQDQLLLPTRILKIFVATLETELGRDTLSAILVKADLPSELIDHRASSQLNGQQVGMAYASIQKALRVYYGRGARGTLLRIGRIVWQRLLESASIPERIYAQLIRIYPVRVRRLSVLNLLARFLRARSDGASVHTLDLDLMLVDYVSATTLGEAEGTPICFVTQGMVEEALFWATGHEHDVEEVSCKAAGADFCEFKVITG